MAAVKTGLAFRFMAKQALAISGVRLRWANVTSPGTVYLGIETVTAATAPPLPSGSLYDPHATLSIIPAVGIQTYSFSGVTTNLTPGTEYAVVLITTAAGTTQTINSYGVAHNMVAQYPAIALVAADGTTRTNFAEAATSVPICSLVLSDGSEEVAGFVPYIVIGGNLAYIYGNNIVALQVATKETLQIAGIRAHILLVGTPAGNLIADIRDLSNNEITGAASTINYNSLVGVNNRTIFAYFPTPVVLPPGTYYVTLASPNSANSSNCFEIWEGTVFSSAVTGGLMVATSSNGGSSWSPNSSLIVPIWLVLDSDAPQLIPKSRLFTGL